jgi:hypothetical protein
MRRYENNPPGADEIIVLPHEELVADAPFVPNARRRDFRLPSGALHGRLEPFVVRTAIVRSDRYKDQPRVEILSAEAADTVIRSLTLREGESVILLGTGAAGDLKFVYEEPVDFDGAIDLADGRFLVLVIAKTAVKLVALTGSRGLLLVMKADDKRLGRIYVTMEAFKLADGFVSIFSNFTRNGGPPLLDVLLYAGGRTYSHMNGDIR